MSKATIFIQIASYRDPELGPTIRDMIANAAYPENLSIAICRQYHPDDSFGKLIEYRSDKRFKIIDVPYNETKGACWARHQIQQLYQNETYTLQIDSHMRFAPSWDKALIGMLTTLQSKGVAKPLITAYAPSYDPKNDPKGRVQKPWQLSFDRFIPEGAIFFLPEVIPNWTELKTPVPARFYSAHFCFTIGAFAQEVQHNPEYYFHGEEISIAVRAYTWGYDLYHPHEVIIWHEYTRKGRIKQWEDDKAWVQKNQESHLYNRQLFGIDGDQQSGHDGKFGFGPERSLQDYEKYAGILFQDRSVQQYTLDNYYPPNPDVSYFGSYPKWRHSFKKIFKHCIDIHADKFEETDYDVWVIAFHDDEGNTIYRQDADLIEIKKTTHTDQPFLNIWREFETDTLPDYWVVWPHSISKGWCNRITGKL